MKIGQAVFQNYQGIRRYGVVTKTIKRNRWRYAEVKWLTDEKYEQAMEYISEMRGGEDFTRYEYRIDELKRINPAQEIDTLNKILAFQASVVP